MTADKQGTSNPQESEPLNEYYFVSEYVLSAIDKELKQQEESLKLLGLLLAVVYIDQVPPEYLMLPVDLRAFGKPFESVGDLVRDCGVLEAARGFLQSRALFLENRGGHDVSERPSPMPARDVMRILASQGFEVTSSEDSEQEDSEPDMTEDEAEELDEAMAEHPPKRVKVNWGRDLEIAKALEDRHGEQGKQGKEGK